MKCATCNDLGWVANPITRQGDPCPDCGKPKTEPVAAPTPDPEPIDASPAPDVDAEPTSEGPTDGSN